VIVGMGIDLAEVPRIANMVKRWGDRFTRRVFTDGEREYALSRGNAASHLAARFAAKEAVLKAFGTGLGSRMRWTDVEIVKERSGRPLVELHGEVAALAERRGLSDLDVSVAHSEGLAVAHAVAVWTERNALPPD
jgi:holo-[acyl-carrier protein] synthase